MKNYKTILVKYLHIKTICHDKKVTMVHRLLINMQEGSRLFQTLQRQFPNEGLAVRGVHGVNRTVIVHDHCLNKSRFRNAVLL